MNSLLIAMALMAAPQHFEMSGGIAVLEADEHYELGKSAFDAGQWQDATYQLGAVTKNFPMYSFAADAHYMRGYAYYQMNQFDFAEQQFTQYLEKANSPRYFEEVFQYKFEIASSYREGIRKHLFGLKRFPKWMSAKNDAIRIYDEIATALPSHELAAQSLFGKGYLLWATRQYQESVEAYQALIFRFPNHANTPDSYLCIADVYLEWCQAQPQNPDLLPLAQVNIRKFRREFPTDERLLEAEARVGEMKEALGESLVATAKFYEKTKKPSAACVYYRACAGEYPGTNAATFSRERLEELDEVS